MRFAICAALLVLGSCSSEPAKPVTPPAQQPVADKPAEKPAEKPTEKPAEKPADPAPAADVASFAVNGNDMMQFDVKQLEVKPGQRVRIVFKNVGSIAKVAMGHNLVVLRKGVSVAEFTPQVTVNTVDASGNITPEIRSIVTRYTYDGLGSVLTKIDNADALLNDPGLRDELAAGARQRAAQLPTWQSAGLRFARVLETVRSA